jgi:hypothetical protein
MPNEENNKSDNNSSTYKQNPMTQVNSPQMPTKEERANDSTYNSFEK